MKVALITFNDTYFNFFSGLSNYLTKNFANVQISQIVLDSLLDLPKKLISLKDFDLIFVSYFYTQESIELKVALEKLIDFEITSQKKVLKLIKKIDPDDFDLSEKDLIPKYGDLIIKELIK
ncbi:MAG: hypothetical protein N3D73_00575 [Candidatus Diapherotrites archaeon]|nr:hypothetical protein [Candidatus Diapherotrites archaeon]